MSGKYLLVLCIVLLMGLFLRTPAAEAGTINVDNVTCTLVDAIAAANTDTVVGGCAAGSGADTIFLSAGNISLTVSNNTSAPYGNNGLPVITSAVTIEGNSVMINRAGASENFRFFQVDTTGNLTLNNLTLDGGRAEGGTGGGCRSVQCGGAVLNRGALTITNSILINNQTAVVAPMTGLGGAIFNDASAILTISDTTFDNNSTVAANGAGGAIFVEEPGTIAITNSTFSNNSAPNGVGGALAFEGAGVGVPVTATITNSTLSGNAATLGSALYNNGSTTTMSYVTIANNTTSAIRAEFGVVTLTNSILFNGINCSGSAILFVATTSLSNGGCTGATFGNALLLPLAYNSGQTQTHALGDGSPAIDTATGGCPATDQRAFARSTTCDKGAFEVVRTIQFTVDTTNIAENPSGTATVTVTSTVNSPGAGFAVNFNLSGTATTGTDYTISGLDGSNNVNFPASVGAGSSNQTFTITAINDGVVDSALLETIILQASSTGATVKSPTQQTLTITDAPTISFSPDVTNIAENPPGIATFTVTTFRHFSGGNLVATFAPSGTADNTDYTIAGLDGTNSLTFPPDAGDGTVTQLFTITAINDGVIDAAALETVIMQMSLTGVGSITGTNPQTVSISDAPTISFSPDVTIIPENPSGTVTFTVTTLSHFSGGNLVATFAPSGTATQGVDYTITGLDGTNSLTFAPDAVDGTVSQTFTITALSDGVIDATIIETVIMQMSLTGAGFITGTNPHTISITDAPTISFNPNVTLLAEFPPGTATFTVTTVNHFSGGNLIATFTFAGTADSADYTISGLDGTNSLTFAPDAVDGTVSQTFTVTAVNDGVLDGTAAEKLTVQMNLTGGGFVTGGNPHTLTIDDANLPVEALPVTTPSNLTFITKSVDKTLAGIGDTLTYTITFNNPKGNTLNSVVISDTFDARLDNITLVSNTIGTALLNGNSLTIQNFTLLPGQTATVVITGQISSRTRPGDVIANTATLESPDASIHLSNTAVTVIAPSTLPATGETPLWRQVGLMALLLSLTAGLFGWLKRKEMS